MNNDVSVVFTGHDHFYERVKPQKGIPYFVVGSGGKLRSGNLDRSTGLTARGFDQDLTRKELNIPEGYALHAAVAVGKLGDKATLAEYLQAREEPSPRRPLSELAAEGDFTL